MEDKKEKFDTTNVSEKKSKSVTEQEMANIWKDYSEKRCVKLVKQIYMLH